MQDQENVIRVFLVSQSKKNVQDDLKRDCEEIAEITAITYDFLTFGDDYVVEYVVCANGKRYRRLVLEDTVSPFVGEQGGNVNV